MRKIFLISSILLSLVVIFFLTIIFFCANPDNLKPLITTQFKKYSNSDINFDDHLSLSFFPVFGVKAKHIQIMAPQGSQTPNVKIDIKNAIVQLKLVPLLHGKIKMGLIQMDELTVNQRSPLLNLRFNDVQLNLSAIDKSDHLFMTRLSFKFAEDSLALSGEAIISSDVTVDTMRQMASLKNIHAVIPGVTLDGELTVSHSDVEGHFTLLSANLKNVLKQINFPKLEMEKFPDINNVNADINLLANKKSFSIRSRLYVRNIQISKINIDDINAKLNFKDNILNMEFSNASAYGGYLNGEMNINLNPFHPIVTAHVKSFNMQMDPLIKLMQASHVNIYPETKMSGTVNIELDIATMGTGIKSLINNLNGASHLSISNGLLMGKEWDDIVTRFATTKTQNLRIFRFKQLSASFKIYNGVFSNENLLIDSSDINIKGKGQINLPNNFIDYELQAQLLNVYNVMDNNPVKEALATIPVRGSLA